jgi:hypothetical protein
MCWPIQQNENSFTLRVSWRPPAGLGSLETVSITVPGATIVENPITLPFTGDASIICEKHVPGASVSGVINATTIGTVVGSYTDDFFVDRWPQVRREVLNEIVNIGPRGTEDWFDVSIPTQLLYAPANVRVMFRSGAVGEPHSHHWHSIDANVNGTITSTGEVGVPEDGQVHYSYTPELQLGRLHPYQQCIVKCRHVNRGARFAGFHMIIKAEYDIVV